MRNFKAILACLLFSFPVAALGGIDNDDLTTTAEASREIGSVKMRWIPAGTFEMGSSIPVGDIQNQYGFDFTEAAKDGWADQLPRHAKTFSSGFWMAEKEVTVSAFKAFISATGYVTEAKAEGKAFGRGADGFGEYPGLTWRQPGWSQSDDHPVTVVSWKDANAYIQWLNQSSRNDFRLPTEAEWEYAARAGTESNFYWGDSTAAAGEYANVLDAYWGDEFSDGFDTTAPVGSYKSNDWGLYDMVGNVWEWTSSDYTADYTVPLEPAENGGKVDRGGGWDSPPYNARIANRGAASGTFASTNLGFRLVHD